MDNFEQKMRGIAQQVHDENSTTDQFAVSQPPFHTHNGADSQKLSFGDLTDRMEFVNVVLPGTTGQTTGNWGVVFTAPFACSIVGATEIHQTAEATANAMNVQIEKLTGTQASGAGTPLLFSSLQSATVAAGGANYAVGDTITLTGGTGTAAVLKVATISGSAVATVTVQTLGAYTIYPTNPVSQGSSSGAGTGATFTLVFANGFNLKATANTLQTGVFDTTTAKTNANAFNLAIGNRIGLVLIATGSAPANLVGVNIVIQLKF